MYSCFLEFYSFILHWDIWSTWTFVTDVSWESNFIPLHVHIQVSLHHLSKIRWPQMWGFISGLSILFQWYIFILMLILYLKKMFIYFEREKEHRESTLEWGRDRERGRERIPSRFCADSMGLNPTNHEIMTCTNHET